jgi:hypothetical protein
MHKHHRYIAGRRVAAKVARVPAVKITATFFTSQFLGRPLQGATVALASWISNLMLLRSR